MPGSKRTPGLVALLLLVAAGSVQAESPLSRAGAAELVNDFWSLVSDVSSRVGLQDRSAAHPRPQAIPQGGRTVDLSDLSQPTVIEDRLRTALQPGADLRVTIPGGTARRGDYSVGSAESLTGHLLVVEGNADVYGTLRGNLVTVKGDVVVHPGGVVTGDILSLGGEVRDRGGEIGGEVRTLRSAILTPAGQAQPEQSTPIQSVLRRLAGVLGVFLTLSVLGFGLVMFGRQNLEVVSDTVSHSFGRAFVTGLLGQILLLPTFGMLVVGLILSVAGILLLPFAIAVFAMLIVVGVVGGYLAVAHAMGET
ncbi:MAG TPA: polymer-forming cytoskeletal protein, partial [Gemmatimonadales bacterium]